MIVEYFKPIEKYSAHHSSMVIISIEKWSFRASVPMNSVSGAGILFETNLINYYEYYEIN